MTRFRLMTACAVPALVMALAAPAHAQETPAPAPAAQDAPSDQEIVVTAQGRAQVLADVPIAVSAVNAEQMERTGATDIRQLNQVAPSLLVSSTGSEANGSARIRGIGTVGDNPGLESSVAVFIDGVYRSRSGIGLNELGELEQVEVLRGPQGTLFGRNASAGIISITSKSPSFDGFHATGEATYGNYNYYRLGGSLNVPLGETLAARVDGVYVKRDGFYHDVTNNTDVNNRDRYFVRGQLKYEPSSNLTVRIIGDYSKRNEDCCGAVYLDGATNPYIGQLNDPNQNSIVKVLESLGQPAAAFSNPYSRNIYVTPGRSYGGKTEDWGVSGQIDWDLGGAKLTSITAYRSYFSSQASDTDYSYVDILYRADDDTAARQFKTFSQELRLQGKALDDHLDWLIGGYYANEDLTVTDNLKFGNQYGRFATCRIVSGSALSALYSPTSPGCLAARPAAFGAASSIVYNAFDVLDAINNKGSTLDTYLQNSRNYAFFTHDIVHIAKGLDLAMGLRYTNERKTLNATFGNNNTGCVANEAALSGFLTNASLASIAGALIGLSCQGNSTAELNGVSVHDIRNENKFTGTAVLSYKPTERLMMYASYSRGYKAGGFNLDRSALKNPIQLVGGVPTATFAAGGAQALVGNLEFAPETVNAFEVGAKYSSGPFSLNLAIFRQEFSNFQLNTFNGSVFLVQNINGCSTNLNGGDRDQSKFTGAPNFNAAASTTGACAAGNVTYGVVSQGVELEASLVPMRDLRVGLGLTYSDTHYRNQLVGNQNGVPLDQALRELPGQQLSNAPEIVATASLAWTPSLGNSGLSGLFYVDSRLTDDYNTGSDLFPQKNEDGYVLVNARVGIRGPDEKWAIEFWGQNLFNENYAQVAFNSPFQEGATSTTTAFADPQYPGGRQLFSAFLAEPRTYGITGRFKF